MNSIVNILLAILLVVIIALQLLGVAVSQKVVNITYGVILLLFMIVNGNWWHI